jgi:methyl-accepting chemotaxis protein
LRKIAAAADEFSQGRFSSDIEAIHRADEVGAAAKAVERLGISIRLALKRLKSYS